MNQTTRRLNVILVCMALAVNFSSGFVPRGSFVPKTPLHSYTHTSLSKRVGARSTALSMNLFDRFARVAKANLNNVLKIMEEPEKILNQAIEDMQVRFLHSLLATTISLSPYFFTHM